MDSWGRDREVEKVKPFADRAQRLVQQLRELAESFVQVFGPNNAGAADLRRAADLLEEAARRGVKGKDVK